VLGGLVGAAFVIVVTLVLKAGIEWVATQPTWAIITVPLIGLALSVLVLEGIGRSDDEQARAQNAEPPRGWGRVRPWITFPR